MAIRAPDGANKWGQHDDLCCGDHDQYGRDDQQRRWVKINVVNFMISVKWEKGKGRNEKCKTQVSISSSAGKMWKSEWNACWDWGRCTSSQFFTQTSNLSYEIVFWRFISWKCVSWTINLVHLVTHIRYRVHSNSRVEFIFLRIMFRIIKHLHPVGNPECSTSFALLCLLLLDADTFCQVFL